MIRNYYCQTARQPTVLPSTAQTAAGVIGSFETTRTPNAFSSPSPVEPNQFEAGDSVRTSGDIGSYLSFGRRGNIEIDPEGDSMHHFNESYGGGSRDAKDVPPLSLYNSSDYEHHSLPNSLARDASLWNNYPSSGAVSSDQLQHAFTDADLLDASKIAEYIHGPTADPYLGYQHTSRSDISIRTGGRQRFSSTGSDVDTADLWTSTDPVNLQSSGDLDLSRDKAACYDNDQGNQGFNSSHNLQRTYNMMSAGGSDWLPHNLSFQSLSGCTTQPGQDEPSQAEYQRYVQAMSELGTGTLDLDYVNVLDAWREGVADDFGRTSHNLIEDCESDIEAITYTPPVILSTQAHSPVVESSPDTEGRQEKLDRYRRKKANRKFDHKVRYKLRKANADQRPRVRGRFVKKDQIPVSTTPAV
eukprot:scaffold34368_cov44-Prasinocladus_malaysianus.AAC.1